MNSKQEKLEAFGRLLDILDDLREQCPWDRKQTLQTLRHLTLEEVYVLSDALLEENLQEIKKELGDVLLHLVRSEERRVGKAAMAGCARLHTRFSRDWSSDVCSSDLIRSFRPIVRHHG